MTTIQTPNIEMEDREDRGSPPRTDGGEEIVVPAPGLITVYVQTSEDDAPVIELLLVGWNSSGSPIIMGEDAGLRLLETDETVRDMTWA